MKKAQEVRRNPWDSYALVVSILLGLLGFLGSFFSSQYGFNQFSINIIWSLILPILVVLAWGLPYGIISITLGLSVLYPFFLGPNNGWASLIPAVSLYLLILMQGYGLQKRKESTSPLYNLYVIQGIYSGLRIMIYVLFFPLLISLNSTFWNPLAFTEETREIVMLFALKGVAVEFILVALGDALLLLPMVRKIFRLKQSNASRANMKIMAAMVLFGLSFTFLVLALNQYISLGRFSFPEMFSSDDFARSTVLLATILFILMGGITVRYVEKMLETQEILKHRENQYRLVNLEVKRLNENLEQRVRHRTEDLMMANQELEEFAHTISHDLKAPLRAIEGYGEFLTLDHGESLGEEGMAMVVNIQKISQNMMGLINRLLEYSTLTKKDLQRENVNMFRVVEQVTDEFRVGHPDKQVKVIYTGDVGEFSGDRILITQVIQNLFSNAVKFRRKEQEWVEIRIHGEVDDGNYRFEFQDQGIGLDKKDEDRVFGMFYKLHKPSDYEGYGIGLPTVKKIIQRHGGEVGIKSIKEKGTTVFFTLPLTKEKEKSHV